MAVAQNNCCAICKKARKLVVDHDHLTGRVRGLLCKGCNTALGVFGDSTVGLRQAIAYLETPQIVFDVFGGSVGLAFVKEAVT